MLKKGTYRFVATVTLIIIMAVATILETFKGSEWTFQHIYHNIGFMWLWGVVFLLFLLYEISSKNYKKKPFILLIIIAFGIILIGGLVTFISGKSDIVHLRKNESQKIENAFSVTLTDFKIQYYEGTTTPSNYESAFTIHTQDQDIPFTVSVNQPVTYKGYRFYQTSYDSDLEGSVLTVAYNPAGIFIIYTGYLLVLLLFIMKFIHYCRKKRRHAVLLPLLLFMLFPQLLSAQKTITKEEGEALGKLAIYYRGRIAPLNTYATDFTRKLTGKTTYKHFSAEQVLAGWLFYPEIWQHEPMIKIQDREIKQRLNIEKRAPFSRFFTQNGESKLPFLALLHTHKGIMEVEEKIAIIAQLHNGNSLTLFPQKNRWYAPVDDLKEANPQDTLFIAGILQLLYESIEEKQNVQTEHIIEKIALFQQSRCETGAISKSKIEAEIFLNTTPFLAVLFPFLLTLALITFGYLVCPETLQKKLRFLPVFLYWSLLAAGIVLTLFLLLYTRIAGHLPLGNSYETVLFLAWLVILLTLVLGKKSTLLLFGGQLLAGFALLMANLNAANPQISSLMPVLHSPWLSIHVSLMMLAYALLAFLFIIALLYWGIKLFNKIQPPHLQQLTNLSKFLLLPAVALLALGIMTGSVWANLSWGRCWGWDPKEVWALITVLGYGLVLCGQENSLWKKEQTYHFLILIAFGLVLITYFGVNVWFSGLHSYQ